MDKEIKEKNKMSINIIKSFKKKMLALKKEENNLIKEIIDLEKKLGLYVDEKKPMLKAGFYFPNRDTATAQIKTVKKEDEKEKVKLKKKKTQIIKKSRRKKM